MSWSHHQPAAPSRDAERGVVGGLEVLPFGVLVFVVGSLLVANAWGVIDAKLATSAAAREAARSFVESASATAGADAASQAAGETISSHGRDPDRLGLELELEGRFARCSRVTFIASYEIPAISLPFGIGFGGPVEVRTRHSEIIDPLRSGLPSEGSCGY